MGEEEGSDMRLRDFEGLVHVMGARSPGVILGLDELGISSAVLTLKWI